MSRLIKSSAYLRCCIALVILVLLLTGCDQAAVSTRTPTTLTIAGATAMQPVLRDLTAEFSHQYPNVLFDLRGGGSAWGEEAVRAGRVDLAASTLFAPTDLDPNAEADDELVHTPIGLDGLALIVHESNSVRALTLLELQRLYSGRSPDWGVFDSDEDSDAGKNDVMLVSREDGSGSRVLFESRVMGEESVSLTSVVMPTSAAVVDFVAANPQAIGYVSRAYVPDLLHSDPEENVESSTTAIGIVAIEGALPTAENLLGQQYALTQPLYLIAHKDASGERATVARQFRDFALGPAGQEIVGRYHARVR